MRRLALDMSRCQGLVNFLATGGGAGYLPWAPGTAGSCVGLLIGCLTASYAAPLRAGLLVMALLIGVAVSTSAERAAGAHDPSFVVIDEVWGMWAAIAAFPSLLQAPGMMALAFVLFRLFDIVKPPPLKWFAKAPAGWGIMLDDVGAAAYTILLLNLVHRP